jgi:predicted metal-dependent phosphoesterase TrpH
VTAVTTRVDAHVKVLDERVVERAHARNIDVLVYAPHFTRLPDIRARAERFSDDDLLVVPAREVFTGPWHQRRHVLAVGLTDPVPDFISLDAALREFERQDAGVLVPHPELLNVSLAAGDIAAHADRIHAVESYNAKCLPPQNRRARSIADASAKPAFGSSYAHLRRTVGEAWTEFEARIDSEAALVRAVREGHPRRVGHRPGLGHRLQGALEFAHLGWENTWGKFDRLLLSGMEATHPRQVAYGGRFDDDVVEPATERLLL